MEIIRSKEEKNTKTIGQIAYNYLPYWPLFLILFVIAIGCAYMYMRYTAPVYESNARIMIKDQMKGVEDSKELQSLDVVSVNKTIDNETEVIQSLSLLTKVVNTSGLYAPVYAEEQFKDVSAYNSSPIKLIAQAPEHLVAAKKVYFTYNHTNKTIAFDGKTYPLNSWVQTPYGTFNFIQNPAYLKPTEPGNKLYFSLIEPKKVAENIGSNLKVSTSSKMSSILTLNYKDEVPQRAIDVLNGIITTYVNTSLADKNALAANTLNFLQDRLANVSKDLSGIEQKLQQYRAEKGAIDISTQGKLFLENVSNNDQKLSEVNMQLAALSQVEKYVKSKDNSGGIVPSTLGISDPTLSTLVNNLYTSELELERLKKTTGDNNPIVLQVSDRINKIKPGILENIQNQRSSLLAMQSNISSTNGSYASVLHSMPQKERQIIDISREQSVKNAIYTFLLQKKEETALSYASNASDSKIIDQAIAGDEPVSPNKKIVYLTAFLVAGFAGMGIVFGRETLNRKIMFRKEIEDYTVRPVVGEITSQSSKQPILIEYDKRTFIAEQFRMLRMTLSNFGMNGQNKRLLVTSSISGEGKSFIASNLAHSLAMTGKKVVLVDFDLNNPSLSHKLDINHAPGVSEYLQEQATADEIMVQTVLHENMFFIPTGELPNNPSELMMNGKPEELLNYLSANFDYIIVDSAPVLPVTEAYILSPLCDATLYVIRHAYTPKIFVERIDENNKINQLKNVAIVFNGIKPRGFNKNYGYGYGYGYVYNNAGSRDGKTKNKIGKLPSE
jgi:tyrosine-protein kinase Etk/Wzc